MKQGEFSQSSLHLRANPNGPNLLQLEQCLLADELALVPRAVMTTCVDSIVISFLSK
jgi:hypothetical protein